MGCMFNREVTKPKCSMGKVRFSKNMNHEWCSRFSRRVLCGYQLSRLPSVLLQATSNWRIPKRYVSASEQLDGNISLGSAGLQGPVPLLYTPISEMSSIILCVMFKRCNQSI